MVIVSCVIFISSYDLIVKISVRNSKYVRYILKNKFYKGRIIRISSTCYFETIWAFPCLTVLLVERTVLFQILTIWIFILIWNSMSKMALMVFLYVNKTSGSNILRLILSVLEFCKVMEVIDEIQYEWVQFFTCILWLVWTFIKLYFVVLDFGCYEIKIQIYKFPRTLWRKIQ